MSSFYIAENLAVSEDCVFYPEIDWGAPESNSDILRIDKKKYEEVERIERRTYPSEFTSGGPQANPAVCCWNDIRISFSSDSLKSWHDSKITKFSSGGTQSDGEQYSYKVLFIYEKKKQKQQDSYKWGIIPPQTPKNRRQYSYIKSLKF